MNWIDVIRKNEGQFIVVSHGETTSPERDRDRRLTTSAHAKLVRNQSRFPKTDTVFASSAERCVQTAWALFPRAGMVTELRSAYPMNPEARAAEIHDNFKANLIASLAAFAGVPVWNDVLVRYAGLVLDEMDVYPPLGDEEGVAIISHHVFAAALAREIAKRLNAPVQALHQLEQYTVNHERGLAVNSHGFIPFVLN